MFPSIESRMSWHGKLALFVELAVLVLMGALGSFATADPALAADARELFETHTRRGDLTGAAAALQQVLQAAPHDEAARTLLGVTQVLQAVEGAAREQYDYGFLQTNFFLRIGFRIPVSDNPHPKPVRYQDVRELFLHLQERLQVAEATLAQVEVQEVHFLVDLSRIGLDLDGDGLTEEEHVATRILGGPLPPQVAARWVIGVDGGDVLWLRGYCHALLAVCDVVLAHDAEPLFNCVGHRYFARPVLPYDFLETPKREPGAMWDSEFILDVIATIHQLNFEVVEPERMPAAHAHLLEVVALSRLSWKLILAETDDDHEWIPNPRQTGQLGLAVTQKMVNGWLEVLDEAERVLQGERLLPFWRPQPAEAPQGGRGRGVNVHKVFHAPQRFDLVLWAHGAGAAPFLEEGALTDTDFWMEMNRTFRNNLLGFGLWFN